MAITDILTQIDPLAGASHDRRNAANASVAAPAVRSGTAEHVGRGSDSEYRQALSRSLTNNRPRAQAAQPGVAQQPAAGAASNPSAPSGSPPTGNASGDTTAAATTDGQSNPQQQPPADAPDEAAPVELNSAGTPELNTGEPEFVPGVAHLAVLEIPAADEELPTPPADLSSLFGPPAAGDATGVDADTDADADAEPLHPPAGLFQTLAASHDPSNAVVQVTSTLEDAAEVAADPFATQSQDAPQLNVVIETEPVETEAGQPRENAYGRQSAIDVRPVPTDVGVQSSIAVAEPAPDAASMGQADPVVQPPQLLASDSAPGPPASTAGAGAKPDRKHEPRQEFSGENRGTVVSRSENVVPEAMTIQPHPLGGRGVERTETAPVTAITDGASSTLPDDVDSSRAAPVVASGGGSSTTLAARGVGSTIAATVPLEVDAEQLVERAATAIRSAVPNGQQLQIRLHPPHLGPLQIAVTSHEGVLSVHMEVQTASARSALLDNMSLLREALVQQGSSLDRIDVQLVEPAPDDGRSEFTDARQQQSQQQEDEQSQQQEDEQPGAAEAETDPTPALTRRGIDGLDIQV